MRDSQPHLEQLFARGMRPPASASRENQEGAEQESDGALPTTDSEYQAFARRSNAPEFSLIVIFPTGRMRGFQYAHLDSDTDFTAECITLRFMGIAPQKLRIHGRNMMEGFNNIHAHRIPWIRVAARPFAEDGKTIITAAEITPIKEEADEANGQGRESIRSAGGGSVASL